MGLDRTAHLLDLGWLGAKNLKNIQILAVLIDKVLDLRLRRAILPSGVRQVVSLYRGAKALAAIVLGGSLWSIMLYACSHLKGGAKLVLLSRLLVCPLQIQISLVLCWSYLSFVTGSSTIHGGQYI